MQLVLDVLSSVSIKRKKPWPKLAWIGQEHDGLYLLDGKRISQLYIPSGKTKKKITKLYSLMNDVCAINVSQNGQYLCGALCDGKIFLWERDKDKLQFITGLPKVFNDADKGNTKNKIFLSSCQTVILLMVGFKKLFLWQKNKNPVSDNTTEIIGTWCQIHHGEYVLPDQSNKETSIDGVFYKDNVVGSCGALSFVFNKGTDLNVTTLSIKLNDQSIVTNLFHNLPNQDNEIVPQEVTENIKCSIKWNSLTRPLYGITPATRVVKGRFVYVCRYSPDGQILAIVLNQKSAKDTRLMFYSTLCGTATIVDLKCCGGSEESSGRLWWVSDIAWTQDSLLLIGITRNGALFMTTKLGEPINLVTFGCMMNMGPSLFLPLHPRIAVRSFQENIPPDCSEISSGSEKDVFHQKFSVAVHPSFPVFVCSDGYIVTIVQFNNKPSHAEMMTNLIDEISRILPNTKHHDVTTVSSEVKKPQDMSATAISIVGTPSENSSAGSTLSGTLRGYGMAKNLDAGMLTFDEGDSKTRSNVNVELTEQQKHFTAKSLLLQALGVGVSCGSHWSSNMSVTMNLLIHAWGKLFLSLLEEDSNCTTLSGESVPFGKVVQFYQSVLEIFQWDMIYQHCLPWLSQFASSTMKSLISFKKFGHKEVIEVCLRLLHMTETSVNEIYTWRAVSDRSSVHLLGDTFSPSCVTVCLPATRTDTIPGNQRSVNLETTCHLDIKLERSWLVVYNYVSKIYQRSRSVNSDREKDQFPDQQLLECLCIIQKKLQEMKSSRNLVLVNKMENLFDQGQKLYIEGKRSHAVDFLTKSFEDSSQSKTNYPQPKPLKLNLEISAQTILETTERINGSTNDLVQQDLAFRLKKNTHTLLAILRINLENYDLKAALALVYSFINTSRHIDLQIVLNTGARLEESPPIFPTDDSHGKLTSSSSLIDLQLSTLTRYPLAWVMDNCALPVVQQFAIFMTCYFTNLPLTVPMPFQPSVHSSPIEDLENDELTKSHGSTNMKYLSQQKVTDAVAEQKLEAFWTVDHAMELLVVSGLFGEAAWFARCLGDWKIAFMLSVIDGLHRMRKVEFYQLPLTHFYFPPPAEVVQPKELMLTKIKSILHPQDDLISPKVRGDQASVSDDNAVPSLQNAFKASVIAGLDPVPLIIEYLMQTLRENISNLEWMVVQGVYLPAPPLYCPQPSRNEEEIVGEEMRKETLLRGKIAKIVEEILAVYRASNCFLLCAQDYCNHIAVQLNDKDDTLPSVIKEFITSDTFHFGASSDNGMEAELSCSYAQDNPESVVRVLRSFQEFCGLMWFLHARDEVALTSRAYSKVKQSLNMGQGEDDKQAVIQKCEEVLTWLTRYLSFSNYLNSTHHVLDGMLTMLTELPLTSETVNILAQYFHTPPPSLSLSILEKLKRLTRKLRNSSGPLGMGNGEPLSVLFQEKCEQRRKEAVPENDARDNPMDLQTVFEFCDSLSYQKDSAYLRFLDTFLLITVSKNITERDHKEIPLLVTYKSQLELVEISGSEQQNETSIRTPKVMNRTKCGVQRSQSFQDVRKKTHGALLSSDGDEKNDRTTLHRSNSLTDLQKLQKTKLSEEVRAMLPRLIWLRKWCSVEEGHTGMGNKGGNKSVSLLNKTISSGAIKVQVPLRMIVNTLWLMENYYTDFVVAKGRCVKDESSRMKKQKWRKRNGGKKKGEREGRKGIEEEEQIKEKSHEEDKVSSEQPMVVSQLVSGVVETSQLVSDQPKHFRHKKKQKVIMQKNEDLRAVSNQPQPSILVQDLDSGDTVVETPSTSKIKKCLFSSSSESVDRNWKSSQIITKELPLLSLSLLENSPMIPDAKDCSNDSADVVLSSSSQKLLQTTSAESIGECGALNNGQDSLTDESQSLSSESLSVGQIRSDFISLQLKPTGNVQNKQSDSSESFKGRRPVKRKIREENSSWETSDKVSTKSKDEGSLLRRIIRSEMRKFIKSQQTQQKSQSSAETTEEEISRKELSSEDQYSVFVKKKMSKDANPMINLNHSEYPRRPSRNKTNSSRGTSEEQPESDPVQESLPSDDGKDKKDEIYMPTNNVNIQPSGISVQPIVNDHQVPTIPMNAWPFWYQAPFPVVPPWIWPNTASRVNDDKAVQVESSEILAEQGSRKENEVIKMEDRKKRNNKESIKREDGHESLQDNQLDSKESDDLINHVAVQTDAHSDNQENTAKESLGRKNVQKKHPGDIPREIRNKVDASEDNIREATNRAEAFEDEVPRDCSEQISGDQPLGGLNVQETKVNGLLCDEGFTIPLLKIPQKLRSSPSPMIPFKIAWPEECVDTDIGEPSEIPLLHLDDIKDDREGFMPVKAPVTDLRRFGSFPLLHLSNQADSSLRNFHFLDIPISQSSGFPLLHFPKTEKRSSDLSANTFIEDSNPKMKSQPGDKKPTEEMPKRSASQTRKNTRAAMSNAREKRRRFLKEDAEYNGATIKSNQRRKTSLAKQGSIESRSSKPRGSVITVQQQAEAPVVETKKRPTRRREKLQELNNIIRDLEREISDESDLVLSEVSELLSQDIKYENFEKKPTISDKTVVENKHEVNKKETPSKVYNKEPKLVDLKPSTISRLHKPSAVSARDIHSEFPPNIPVETSSSDAKVGTVKIIQLPVSIQTDGIVQPPDTFNDLPKIPRPLETREFSIQTDIKDVSRHNREVCDAGMNTEDTSLMKDLHPMRSDYPRLPPDVYLNLNSLSACEDGEKNIAEESPRMFISVADIGQDVVRKRIQSGTTLRNKSEENKYPEHEAEVNMDGDVPRTVSPKLSLDSSPEVSKAGNIHGGDPTTVDALSSSDLHSSSVYPLASRVKSTKQAQTSSQKRLSQRLQEMNEQFDVIDEISSNMDRDLQRSNMLLRTIDNLNKVTDHISPAREKRTQDEIIRHESMKDERKSIWQEPPWTKKPMEKLTELTDNENAEIKKPDSDETESEDNEEFKETQDDTQGETQGETPREIESNEYNRKSSLSSLSSEPISKRAEEILPTTTASNINKIYLRDEASVISQDTSNFSEDKFKDLLVTSMTSTVANSRAHDRTPQKQEKLNEWMVKKRKIRHKEWAVKLSEKREAEHKPFQSKTQGEQVMSSKKIKKIEDERKDIRRAQKKEHVDERLMSAYDLMNEMIAEPVPKAPIPIHNPTRSTKYKNDKKTARAKTNNRYKDNRGGKQPRTKRTTATKNNKEVKTRNGLSGMTSLDLSQSKSTTAYVYDIQESGRRFVTRKSYERYQNRKSENLSYDLQPSLSLGRSEEFNIKHSFDSRVDELLDDVSLGETIDDVRFDHLDSLLSGDSELRDLLSDVIVERGRHHRDDPMGNDDVISINSRISLDNMTEKSRDRRKNEKSVGIKQMLGTFKVVPKHEHGEERRFSGDKQQPDSAFETVNNWKVMDALELSDEVAALLAEAKAAVGDDFSGTSEVGEIDWDEVDNVLQEN